MHRKIITRKISILFYNCCILFSPFDKSDTIYFILLLVPKIKRKFLQQFLLSNLIFYTNYHFSHVLSHMLQM